jgi:phage protein D
MADLNDPSAPVSTVRTPRLRALLNGAPDAGLLQFEIESNNHYRADTFTASFVTDQLDIGPMQTLAWWSAQTSVAIEIDASLDGQSWVPIFTGEVDGIDADPLSTSLSVHGRDLSRRLIDAKTQETFANQTSSEVATTLAGRHGLTPVVAATTTPVSRFYAADHDHLTGDSFSRTITEWDLLVYLAQREQFDVFVQNMELHFQPVTTPSSDAYVVRLDRSGPSVVSNVMRPTFSRSLTLAADIEVWVRSWNAGKKAGFTAKSGGAKGKGPGDSTTSRVVVTIPNLTQDEADKRAASIRADMTQHERVVTFMLPGETMLTARGLVRVEGSGTSWDQTYYIDSIRREMSMSGGFKQTVRAKNTSPANQSIPA